MFEDMDKKGFLRFSNELGWFSDFIQTHWDLLEEIVEKMLSEKDKVNRIRDVSITVEDSSGIEVSYDTSTCGCCYNGRNMLIRWDEIEKWVNEKYENENR